MVDLATNLDKVAAKLAEVGPSWTKVGLKLAPRWRQDGPKQEKSSPGPGHRGQGGIKEGSRRGQVALNLDKKWSKMSASWAKIGSRLISLKQIPNEKERVLLFPVVHFCAKWCNVMPSWC